MLEALFALLVCSGWPNLLLPGNAAQKHDQIVAFLGLSVVLLESAVYSEPVQMLSLS